VQMRGACFLPPSRRWAAVHRDPDNYSIGTANAPALTPTFHTAAAGGPTNPPSRAVAPSLPFCSPFQTRPWNAEHRTYQPAAEVRVRARRCEGRWASFSFTIPILAAIPRFDTGRPRRAPPPIAELGHPNALLRCRYAAMQLTNYYAERYN
jgi:hypothetical protein